MNAVSPRYLTKARLCWGAMCVWLSSVACLGRPEGHGASSGAPPPSPCKNVSVCAALTLADVDASLSASFVDIEPWLDSASGPDMYLDSCRYAISDGSALVVERACYVDAGAASSRFDALRLDVPPPTAPGSRTELTGVGDQAFFDDSPSGSADHIEARLLVIDANVIVDVYDAAMPADEDVQPALVTFANLVLVAQ